jgi:hypothetical protein
MAGKDPATVVVAATNDLDRGFDKGGDGAALAKVGAGLARAAITPGDQGQKRDPKCPFGNNLGTRRTRRDPIGHHQTHL